MRSCLEPTSESSPLDSKSHDAAVAFALQLLLPPLVWLTAQLVDFRKLQYKIK